MTKPIIVLSILVSLHLQPAVAQESDDLICLPVARLYFPSSDAIRAIEQSPVPEEFREIYFNREFCDAWVALDQSLVTANLKFGNEASTATALGFIEGEVLVDRPSSRQMRRTATERAELVIANATLTRRLRGAEQAERVQLSLERGKVLSELAGNGLFPYGRVARYYAEAAEFYSSEAFLADAARLIGLQEEQLQIFQTAASNRGVEDEDLHSEFVAYRDLKERLAVLGAVLQRTPDSIDAAHDLMLDRFIKAYAQIADAYGSGGIDSICSHLYAGEFSLTDSDFRDIETDPFLFDDCDHQQWEFVIRTYWYRLSVLEALMRADTDSFRRLTDEEIYSLGVANNGIKRPNVLTRRRPEDGTATEEEQRRRLPGRAFDNYIAMANVFRSEDPTQLGRFSNPLVETAQLILLMTQFETEAHNVFNLASEAMRWVAPYEHPGLWRKIAQAYLASLAAAEYDYGNPQQTAYVRETLRNLDTIAVGDTTPNSSSRP